MPTVYRTLIGIISLAAAAAAGDMAVSGPITGFLLDSRTGNLRTIDGLPGSSLLGAPLPIPLPIAAASVPAGKDYAIVVTATQDRKLAIATGLHSASPGLTEIAGVPAAPTLLVSNATGSAVGLLWQSDSVAQVITGLPDAARAGPLLDLSPLDGRLVAAALDEKAETLLVATAGSRGAAVYRVRPHSAAAPELAGSFRGVSAIAFCNRDNDAAVTDPVWNEVLLLRDVRATPYTEVLATEADGVSAPLDLRVSEDGGTLWVAHGAARITVHRLGAGSAGAAQIALPIVPTQLRPVNAAGLLLLNEAGSGPLLLLEPRSRNLYWVPAQEAGAR